MTESIKIGILIAVLAAATAAHYFLERKAVAVAIETTTTKIETQYKTKLIAAQKLAADQTAALNALKAQADKEKQDAVQTVDDKYRAIVSELQKRPTRTDLTSSVATAVASARKACTGAQLYREDAEFLAGEAARADKVIIERDYYYGRYEAARGILTGKGSDAGQNAASPNARSVP